MGKIMSMLEKYNLVEKELDETNVDEPIDHNPASTPPAQEEKAPKVDAVQKQPLPNEKKDMPKKETPKKEATDSHFDQAFSLEDIYMRHHLDGHPVTDTVFVLENLIKALPEELPEYVKQTTIDNIIAASAMDLPKLLSDGNMRHTALNLFLEDYTKNTTEDVAKLKEEIAHLSQIISTYQKQIKYREQLLHEQTQLVREEEERLDAILNFFSK